MTDITMIIETYAKTEEDLGHYIFAKNLYESIDVIDSLRADVARKNSLIQSVIDQIDNMALKVRHEDDSDELWKMRSILEEVIMVNFVKMIDPPAGWRYGFPKVIPENVGNVKNGEKSVIEWLLENGYPQREIDSLGDNLHCRYWYQEIKE
jgi:hypothetical protein